MPATFAADFAIASARLAPGHVDSERRSCHTKCDFVEI